jgi:hypothetical protein
MSDQTKRGIFLLVLGAVFVGIIWLSSLNKQADSPVNSHDPSVLPPPTREFGEWVKYWEQQR